MAPWWRGRQSQRRESGSTPADSTRRVRSTRRKAQFAAGMLGEYWNDGGLQVAQWSRRSNFRLSVPARGHAQARSTKRPSPDHDLLPEVRTVHGEKMSSLGLTPETNP